MKNDETKDVGKSDYTSKSFLIRNFGKIISVAIFLFIIFTASIYFYGLNYLNSPGPLRNNTIIVIKSGSTFKEAATILDENDVIKMPDLFTIVARITGQDKSIHAGEYEFSPSVTVLNVLDKITSGDVVVRKVTIAEGLMTVQILDIIKNTEGLTGPVPDDIVEGALLPETYDYYLGDSREKLIRRMQKSMNDTLDQLWSQRVEGLPIKSKQEALILASIIEKETGVSDERAMVAGVFVNRLRKNMRLQTDPTVIYAITKGKYVLDRKLLRKDLEIDSYYNTYKIYGLPPTAIANPGKASIEAALNPEQTDNLYFVADGTGGHSFAKTLKEHNNNVQKWRKINKGK